MSSSPPRHPDVQALKSHVEPTVSARVLWPFIEVTRELGMPPELGLRAMGYSSATLKDPETRIPWSKVQRALRAAIEWSGREDLGLLAAERVAPGAFDLVEFAARSQPTLIHAAECLCRLLPLDNEAARARLVIEGSTTAFEYDVAPGCSIEPASCEFALAYFHVASRRFTGKTDLCPLGVSFRHPAPKDTSAHQRIFGTSVQFNSGRNCLTQSLEVMRTPLVHADSQLGATLERIGQQFVAALPRATTLRQSVRNLIAQQLAQGSCTCESVAATLSMTPRTLLRRLKEEETTFRDELDDMRRAIALSYLEGGVVPVTELAYVLGFSTVTSFHRAFKRWTGTTPREYRRRVATPPGAPQTRGPATYL